MEEKTIQEEVLELKELVSQEFAKEDPNVDVVKAKVRSMLAKQNVFTRQVTFNRDEVIATKRKKPMNNL
jgi:hypothetical protein